MSFRELLHQLWRLVAAWLIYRLSGHAATTGPPEENSLFDFNAFDNDDDLPPPPDDKEPRDLPRSNPFTALIPVYILIPKNLQMDGLIDLLALSIIDPPTAEAARWGLLTTMKIERGAHQTPVDAWLKQVQLVSQNPDITLALMREQPLSTRAQDWILFLVGIDTNSDTADDEPQHPQP